MYFWSDAATEDTEGMATETTAAIASRDNVPEVPEAAVLRKYFPRAFLSMLSIIVDCIISHMIWTPVSRYTLIIRSNY